MQNIDLEEAMYFLMSAERHNIADSARWPSAMRWVREGNIVAFSTDEDNLNIAIDGRARLFTGEDSLRLRKVGIAAKVSHKTSNLSFTFDSAGQKM